MFNHLKRSVIAAAAVLAVSLGGSTAPASAAGNYWDYLLPPYGACGTAAEGDMSKTYAQWTNGAMCLVNAARENYGRQPYTMYMNLIDSAYKKASDISVCQPDKDAWVMEDGKWIRAPHRPCGQPTAYHHRWLRPCAGTSYFWENYYLGSGAQSTARAAVSWWLNSDEGHREALLSTKYTAHGIMYSGPTTYPKVGPDTRIWVSHMGHCG
jgi:cysteine-rich secretory family protein